MNIWSEETGEGGEEMPRKVSENVSTRCSPSLKMLWWGIKGWERVWGLSLGLEPGDDPNHLRTGDRTRGGKSDAGYLSMRTAEDRSPLSVCSNSWGGRLGSLSETVQSSVCCSAAVWVSAPWMTHHREFGNTESVCLTFTCKRLFSFLEETLEGNHSKRLLCCFSVFTVTWTSSLTSYSL